MHLLIFCVNPQILTFLFVCLLKFYAFAYFVIDRSGSLIYNLSIEGGEHMGIGARLKEIIDEKGTNVNQLAKITDTSPMTIYSIIKRDNTKVDIDILLKICKALGVSVEEIYNPQFSKDTDLILSTHEKDVLIAYRKQPDMQQAVDKLLGVESVQLTSIFRAAKSTDNHPPEIVETTKDFSKIPPTTKKL